MPIKHAIWKVGEKPAPLAVGQLATEQHLEEMIVADPRILSSEWMLIGRQEQTAFGGFIDLLAIAPDASLVLIELKRNRTPREIVAQALDYASWVEDLTAEKIARIYQRYSRGGNLVAAFQQRFGTELDEETLNESHQIVIVAAELDDASERIIRYLNDRAIPINVLFFQVFQHGTEQLLSRAWLIEPTGGAMEDAYAGAGSAEGKKKRQWDEASYFAELQSKSSPPTVLAARRLLDWCKANVTRIWWGKGIQSGSFVPVFEQGATKRYLFAAYTGAPKSKPTIQLYFAYWSKQAPFDSAPTRLEMLRRLNDVNGIALPDSAIEKWPSIPLETLANDAALGKFLDAMAWFLDEVKRAATEATRSA
jgi:Endonuclease NucS